MTIGIYREYYLYFECTFNDSYFCIWNHNYNGLVAPGYIDSNWYDKL